MPSDWLRLFIVLMASISALLFARFLARAMARTQSAEAPRIPPAAPATPTPAAGPAPQEVAPTQLPLPMMPVAAVRERRRRRLRVADARKGIVLATILGPCRADSPAHGHDTWRPDERTFHR